MTTFLLSFLLLFASPNRVLFEEASAKEFAEIQQLLLSFYSEQLVNSGLIEDLDKAIEAATIEWNQESADRELHCCHLVSNDSSRYGYLVYSITDQSAYLDGIFLEKNYRGQGFGKQILQDFEVELKKETLRPSNYMCLPTI